MFVWLDETGSDRRNNIRRYGYGLRGITPGPVDHQLRIGGNRVSAIGVMSMRGVEDVYIHEGTVNGDVFEDFLSIQHCFPHCSLSMALTVSQ